MASRLIARGIEAGYGAVRVLHGVSIEVNEGETVALRLENPDPVSHAFAIDEFGVKAVMPAGSESLALFEPTTPGTYTFYCPPHYDQASGNGMHGTLIVEP